MKRKNLTYYVRKRLLQNKAAVASGFIIIIYVLVALSGNLLMPDKTMYANDGAIEIQKKEPGFSCLLLKLPKPEFDYQQNFWDIYWKGYATEYLLLPVKNYTIQGAWVAYEGFQKTKTLQRIPLAAFLDTKFPVKEINTYVEDGFLVYETNAQKKRIKYQTARKIFETNHVEKRTYWLGTDKAGRDLLSRLMYGARISLSIGIMSVLISLVLGCTIGALGGYFGGLVDKMVQWLMTMVWSVPAIMLVIAISLALQSKGIWVAYVAVGLTTWVEVARVIRGQIMAIKEKTFIEAAKALGYSHFRIISRHIFPNLIGPMIVIASSNFANALLIESGLNFLGLGIQPPIPSWGVMISEGYHALGTSNSWHLIVFPSITISILVLAFNLFGNGLRDAYDPSPITKW